MGRLGPYLLKRVFLGGPPWRLQIANLRGIFWNFSKNRIRAKQILIVKVAEAKHFGKKSCKKLRF